MGNKTRELVESERDRLALAKAQGLGVRACARELGRGISTVSEELKRGSLPSGEYVAIYAQHRSELRKANRQQREQLKNPWLYSYVYDKLREGWSPEQITGRLKKDYPEDRDRHLSPETIYQFIYDPDQAIKRLWEYLPRKQTKRRKQHGRSVHSSMIPDRVSIHDRPEEVDTRVTFGHWEGDTVEGQRSKHDGIHTEVERLSRKLMALKVGRIASRETTDAQLQIFGSLPAAARLTTTLDNGREHHLHSELTASLGLDVYFADPYSSWQRGSNEYHNGLIRRYLPKKTDFTDLTQEELDDIVEEINNRPRKCLDYATPNEVFLGEINKLNGRVFV
ncbi:MAG: IS30 family transposase [Candidatus Saccharimonadales bacterium]